MIHTCVSYRYHTANPPQLKHRPFKMKNHSGDKVLAIVFLAGGVSSSCAFVDHGPTTSVLPVHVVRPRILETKPSRPKSRSSYSRNRFTVRGVTGEEIRSLTEQYDEPDETVKSLRRLLARQEADMKTTEKLLQSLDDAKEFDYEDAEKNLPMSAAPIIMGFDYGFVSRSEGAGYSEFKGDLPGYEHGPPANVWKLGWAQFWRNLDAMKGEYKDEPDMHLTPRQRELHLQLESLTLDSNEIWKREEETGIEGPWIIKGPYLLLCWLLDVLFEGKYVFSRFFLLETVARMPYFSYIAMIHFYETLGFWRRSADVKRIHFAEELNEFRHLLIAESLGGDQEWWVRCIAQHSAILYYFVLCFLWLVSPSLSYEFSRLLETHAVHTYGQFLDENEETLKALPPPLKAVEYYVFGASDPFYAEFQISAIANDGEIRRPGDSMRTLYDTYKAIQADEGDHVTAMKACLDPSVNLISPSIEKRLVTAAALVGVVSLLVNGGEIPSDIGIDSSTVGLEGFGITDGILETAASGLAAFVSQIVGGASPDTIGAIDEVEGAVGGTALFMESASIEKAGSALIGGLASIFGLSTLAQPKKKEDLEVEGDDDDDDDDLKVADESDDDSENTKEEHSTV